MWTAHCTVLKGRKRLCQSLFHTPLLSVFFTDSMLCLDSKSDRKYCPGAARGKKTLMQVPVVSRIPRFWTCNLPCVPFIPIERSEDAVWLVGDQQCAGL